MFILVSVISSAVSFRFGTHYNDNGDYIGGAGGGAVNVLLQPPHYSYDHPYASPSNIDYRRKYYTPIGRTAEGDAPILKSISRQNADGDFHYE